MHYFVLIPYWQGCASYCQGRREPNVGPGTAQTWMGPLSSSKSSYDVMGPRFCDVQNRRRKCCCLVPNMMWSSIKKRSSPEFRLFFRPKSSDLQKKKKRSTEIRWSQKKKKVFTEISTVRSTLAISMALLSLNAIWMGPSRAHGPRGHCPPLSEALIIA